MMFEIAEISTDTDIARIVAGYHVLFQYDRDMLFTGFNVYGARILGSLSKASRKDRRLRYFHCQITERRYDDFINQRISYLSLLQRAGTIFIVDKTFDGVEIATYFHSIRAIPETYLPLPSFMCPPQEQPFSHIITAKLQGGTANQHRVMLNTLTEIREDITNMILQPTKTVRIRKGLPNFSIYERASTPSSYALSFEVTESVDNPSQLVIDDPSNLFDQFILAYLQYCFQVLPNESQAIVDNETEPPAGFANLLDLIARINRDRNDTQIDMNLARIRLIKALLKSIGNLSDITSRIGSSFTNIVLLNGDASSNNVIGVIDEELIAPILSAAEVIEKEFSLVQEDDRPLLYSASIYHLNTDTRQGNAVVRQEGGTAFYRPKIHILGDGELTHSKFTESLHEGVEITVRGKARRVDGKIRKLEIEFEDEV
ncbi:MAG: hypothetical protein ABIR47_05470 [Candidatus Kapaibacterium sp.]